MTLRATVAIVAVLAVISAGVAAALVFDRPSATETNVVAQLSQPPNQPEALAAVTGGGTAEGIQVHGHWVIEVRDPDGTLVERREFKNALNSPETLAMFLAREKSVGLWEIQLRAGSTETFPCKSSAGLGLSCYIVESGSSETDPNFFKTLSVSRTFGDFILSGTATATGSGSIGMVWANVSRCDPSVAPSTPCETTAPTLTATTLTSPVSTSDGQSIQVTVTISFS